MDQRPITADEFSQRLARLCLTAAGVDLPRKHRDRQILLHSVALCLSPDRFYSERELNREILLWLSEVGMKLEVDHAALRRYLIDDNYLERAADGSSYRRSRSRCADLFASDVDELDPRAIVENALIAAREHRDRFRARETKSP